MTGHGSALVRPLETLMTHKSTLLLEIRHIVSLAVLDISDPNRHSSRASRHSGRAAVLAGSLQGGPSHP